MITVEARVTGRRRPVIPHWKLPLFDNWVSGSPLTLRDLISRIVREEVLGFRERQREGSLVRVLSERDIETGVDSGRLDSGGRTVRQKVDDEQAVGLALEAFEDGLYFVFVDERQYQDLEEQVILGTDSAVTFIRLVPLAGG